MKKERLQLSDFIYKLSIVQPEIKNKFPKADYYLYFTDIMYYFLGSLGEEGVLKNVGKINEIIDFCKETDEEYDLVFDPFRVIVSEFHNNHSQFDEIKVLNALRHLKGFNINEYSMSVVGKDLKSFTDICKWSNLGFPIFFKSNNRKIFKWCLENGADLSLKTKTLQEYETLKEHYKKTEISNKECMYYNENIGEIKIKQDGLDFKEYIYKYGLKSIVNEYNKLVGSNVVDKIVIRTIKDLVDAVTSDNREVYNDLDKYKEIISKEKLRGKNLLFYAMDKNRLDWVVKMVESKMVDSNDIDSYSQSALYYAVSKKRPHMIKLFLDNQFFAKEDLDSVNKLFHQALYYYPKLAAKLEVHGVFKLDESALKSMLEHSYWMNSFYYAPSYQELKNKELSVFEKKLISIDLEELGVKSVIPSKKPKI